MTDDDQPDPDTEGGEVRQTEPILVGEKRPEVLWGRPGQYVQAAP